MTRETARVEAFSDGVFAIAITLLILEIRVPHLPLEAGNAELGAALRALWPSFLTFAGTFGAILTMWINHHGFFDLLKRVDRRFLYANGLLLLLITFVPFPTALLAAYLDRPGANVASAFYCATYVAINVAYNLLWFTAARDRRLIRPSVDGPHRHAAEAARQRVEAGGEGIRPVDQPEPSAWPQEVDAGA